MKFATHGPDPEDDETEAWVCLLGVAVFLLTVSAAIERWLQ